MAAAKSLDKYSARRASDDFDSDFFNKYATMDNYLSRGASDEVTEDEIDLRHKIKENSEKKEIYGLAILNEFLFLAREESSDLEVYNCNNFQESKLVIVDGLVSARDMCSCNINTCLYILDDKDNSSDMEILGINSDGEVLKRWPTKDGWSLSGGLDGNVIMAASNGDLLSEYSPNGVLLREINLSWCPVPLHAIKVNNDRYIVSTRDYNKSEHRLCLVDEEGNVEKSFGQGVGSTKKQLNVPLYFAVGKSGYVIVADTHNDRMLLLDSNLEFKTEIVSKYKQKFLHPSKLCLSETLLVVLIRGGDPNNSTVEETEHDDNDISTTKSNEMVIEEDCGLLVFDIEPILQKY